MGLTKIAVKRPITTLMVVLLIILIGVVSLGRITLDLFPDITFPVAVVVTDYPGVGPAEVENIVTKPLEEIIGSVSNIKTISSTSSEGRSMVMVELNQDTDMDFASLELREKIDMISSYLPDEASNPMIFQFDPSLLPIMQIALKSGEDTQELLNLIERELVSKLESIDGVASVSLTGGNETEILIEVNQENLNKYALSVNQLSQTLMMENFNLPGGSIVEGGKRLTIRTLGDFETLEEIALLPINTPYGIITLNDVATITTGIKNADTLSMLNGENAIGISIQKESGTNTVEVSKEIKSRIDDFVENNPTITVSYTSDQSSFISHTVDTVANNAVLGGILAVVILFIFLKSYRSTFIIATAIPISLISVFILMYFSNITFNMVSLGGIALGIGMLVDNSIVVLENIFRYIDSGVEPSKAAVVGTKEVANAITASTLTTIGVFLPIIFVEGLIASIFKEMAMVVTFSMLASLVIALTFIPMLCSKFLKKEHKEVKALKWFDKGFNLFTKGYDKIIRGSLKKRLLTIIIIVIILFGSVAGIKLVGTEFMPAMDQGEIVIQANLPEGTVKSEINETLFEVNDILDDYEQVQNIFIDSSGSGALSGGNENTNFGTIYVKLTPIDDRELGTADLAELIRAQTDKIAGADISVAVSSYTSMLSGGSSALTIEIYGDDFDVLKGIADDISVILSDIEGTREIETDLKDGMPEIQIVIDRQRATTYGYSTAAIATLIKTEVEGVVASKLKLEGEEIDMRIVYDADKSWTVKDLENISFLTPNGSIVFLSELATIEKGVSPVEINRIDQKRVVSVGCNYYDVDLGTITQQIEQALEQYTFPIGYSYSIGGESQQMNETFSSLYLAGGLAIAIVFMILAAQFESLLYPFPIMMSVPFALGGAILGLVITNTVLGATAFIGAIMLIGIVVNNAIVMLDYTIKLQETGLSRTEAIAKAGVTRMRPIFMTTLTTALGLLPMALATGEGAEMEKPMAIAVISGLVFSTLVTLVVVPVVYTLIDDMKNQFRKKVGGTLNE